MSNKEIESICGDLPSSNKLEAIKDNPNYVFDSDISFNPLTLFDVEGNSVTVRSLIECAYYVNGGWRLDIPSTINENFLAYIGVLGIGSLFLVIYFLRKKRLNLNFKLKIFNKVKANKNVMNFSIALILFFQQRILFDYVSIKSQKLKTFVDEYIALTSNVQFFKNLDFNAGGDWGGSYSIYLTSGPISAIGSVIGWNIFDNFTYSRISNFYWIIFLQLIFIVLYKIYFKWDVKFLLLSISFIFLLIPWWQGVLFSLGEFASVVLFTNACFIYQKSSKFSFLLFGISIFFGKLLTLLSFIGFFIFKFIEEKKIKKSIYDLTFFIIPLILWLVLVAINYDAGTTLDYLQSQYDLIISHQSSGLDTVENQSNQNLFEKIKDSEYSNWNLYDKTRLLLLPLLFLYLLLKNKITINERFNSLAYPLIGAVSLPLIWFWFLSGTKWMRYSQHFTIICILSIFVFINENIFKYPLDKLFVVLFLVLLFDDSKFLIYPAVLISLLFFIKKYNKEKYFKLIIVLFLSLNYLIPFTESENQYKIFYIENCSENLLNTECKNNYFQE